MGYFKRLIGYFTGIYCHKCGHDVIFDDIKYELGYGSHSTCSNPQCVGL